ncbi:hypothetical protein VpasPP24_29 [Vibrio phage Vpas_PP24]|nr:hypothetical protein VpasPP24_29 [Vibrio phage Vpas_PP24]
MSNVKYSITSMTLALTFEHWVIKLCLYLAMVVLAPIIAGSLLIKNGHPDPWSECFTYCAIFALGWFLTCILGRLAYCTLTVKLLANMGTKKETAITRKLHARYMEAVEGLRWYH